MFTIKTLNKISPEGLDLFDKSRYAYNSDVEKPDAVLVRSASMHEMEFPSSLKAIGRAGAGVNNIPVDRCSEAGIVVFNTPGANANAVKELVIGGLVLSSRKIVEGIMWAKTLSGNGAEVAKQVEAGKGDYTGPEVMGKSLGVIGLGAIGVMVANAAVSLGMKVYGYDPYLSVERAWGLSRKIVHAKTLKEVYENSDYITVHVPFNPETKGFINSESIGLMKSGVRILNFARGELVETEDIIKAVQSGKVGRYITDFPIDDYLNIDGIVCIPHLGASTPESEDNCARMAVDQLKDYLENGNIINSVNLPDVSLERSGEQRLCIIHKNISNMLTQISSAISEAGINIANLVNKSRKDYAYTMIDIDSPVTPEQIAKIEEIGGVVRVRLIV